MIPQELRLTLLWWFGTTDPEVIHETQESRRPAPDGEGEMTYAEMLKRSAAVLETHGLPHPACDVSTCPRCESTGRYQRLPNTPDKECAVCHGTGRIKPGEAKK